MYSDKEVMQEEEGKYYKNEIFAEGYLTPVVVSWVLNLTPDNV